MILITLCAEGIKNCCDQGFSRVCAFNKKVLHALVGIGKKHFAHGGLAVTTRTAAFLIIGFHAAGHLVVTDKSNV